MQVRLESDRTDWGIVLLSPKSSTWLSQNSHCHIVQHPHPEDTPEDASRLLRVPISTSLPQAALVTLLCGTLQTFLLSLQVSVSRSLPQGLLPQVRAGDSFTALSIIQSLG